MDDNGRIKNENPFAFPLKKDVGVNQGMTLRDYFAAKAMHAMYVNSAPQLCEGKGLRRRILILTTK